MNSYLVIGSILVTIAFLNYTVFIVLLGRSASPRLPAVFALISGIIMDCSATGFMIAGSGRGYFTLHGIIGYSALVMMVIDGVIITRGFFSSLRGKMILRSVRIYSIVAYSWWVIVFLTGLMTAVIKTR